jgi:hypothetical protein
VIVASGPEFGAHLDTLFSEDANGLLQNTRIVDLR